MQQITDTPLTISLCRYGFKISEKYISYLDFAECYNFALQRAVWAKIVTEEKKPWQFSEEKQE